MSITGVLPLILAAIVVLIVVKRGGGPWRTLHVEPGQADTVLAANTRMRARTWLAFGAGVAVLGVLSAAGFALAGVDLGRIVLVAPIFAVIGATLVIALAPTATLRESTRRRAAELAPRKPWHFSPRWLFLLTLALLCALVMVVVALGISADTDGRSVTRVTELTATSASPYPGFFYGVPLLAAVVALAGVAGVALSRIAAAPRPTAEQLREADEVIRQMSTRLVLKLAAAAVAATLGAVLVLASSATRSIGDEVTAAGEVLRSAHPALEILARVELCGGIAIFVGGIALLVWAVRDASRTLLDVDSKTPGDAVGDTAVDAADSTAGNTAPRS